MSASRTFNTAYLEAADNDGLDVTGAQTLFAWVRRTGTTGSTTSGLIAKWQADATRVDQRSHYLGASGGGSLVSGASGDGLGTGSAQAGVGSSITLNTWAFVASVFIPSTSLTIYKGLAPDSIVQDAQTTTSIPATIFTGTAPLWIGRVQSNSDNNRNFKGQIAVAGYIAQALTLTELKQIAHGVNPIELFGSNVKAYYKIFGEDSPEFDHSGNANNLVLTNGTPAASAFGPPIHEYNYNTLGFWPPGLQTHINSNILLTSFLGRNRKLSTNILA
jgi:hypothetical protein